MSQFLQTPNEIMERGNSHLWPLTLQNITERDNRLCIPPNGYTHIGSNSYQGECLIPPPHKRQGCVCMSVCVWCVYVNLKPESDPICKSNYPFTENTGTQSARQTVGNLQENDMAVLNKQTIKKKKKMSEEESVD